MKGIVSTIAILKYLWTFQCLSAQIVIHDTDIMKLYSTYKINYDLMSSGTDTGQSGINQFWDLSKLKTIYSDTIKIMPMSSSPVGKVLPGNRVLMKINNGDNCEFYSSSHDMLSTHGHVLVKHVIIQNKPAEVKLKFPAVYGQTHQGEFSNYYTYYTGNDSSNPFDIDSLRHRTTVRYSYTIDAWGKLITPSGTFDVLRQRVSIKKNDSIDILRQNLDQWIPDYDISEELETRYIFWSNSEYLPIAILNDYGNKGTIQEASWLQVNDRTEIVHIETSEKLKAYPNPAENILCIELTDPICTEVELLDASGRSIHQFSIQEGSASIDILGLSKGVYFITLPQYPSIRPVIFVKK